MPEYLVYFVHQHFDFRYPELEALLTMQALPGVAETVLNDPVTKQLPAPESSPLVRVQLPSERHAKFLSERGILVKGVYEVWGHTATGGGYDELVASVEGFQGCKKQEMFNDERRSWRINASVFGKKLSMDEQQKRRERFRDVLPFAGPVQMKSPDETFLILEELHLDQELTPSVKPKQMFFLRELAGSEKNRGRGGARDLVDQQTLKRRAYIGPTSMESEMALLMSNMALTQPGDLVIDPFVGTGSVLIPCGTHGATCFGTDIDIRVLLGTGVGVTGAGAVLMDGFSDGKARVNVITNFKQYGLPLPELIRADNSDSPLAKRCCGFFDAVVCDPPYGIRAGARKSGRKRQAKGDTNCAIKQENYIAPTQPYAAKDVMKDLLEFSAQTLREGGRLVYLLPTTYEYTDADLPRHSCLQVLANSEQKLTKKYARRLVTMIKRTPSTSEIDTVACAVTPLNSDPSFANLRDKIRKRKSEDESHAEELLYEKEHKPFFRIKGIAARTMTSMSLKFILCDPEDVSATCSRQDVNEECDGKSSSPGMSFDSTFVASSSSLAPRQATCDQKSSGLPQKLDRQQHTRQLQNLRQRRYRERKKLSASALHSNSEQLHHENTALEAAILERFKSRTSV
ncbi:unnamed protein product [Hyaloperonospora brassicae]|uniref:tRNA (guanine(10)-N(2))-methyltransferase n=1 Tax=Hyaloperonospora brassicae TaxID=162125 RepID=A0AAV0TM12_HYABA|nr:unnamed protein product [Hyaloperonospora brassicae]